MSFEEVLKIILDACPFLKGREYDGIIVKKLAATNTISDTGTSHQSHMAFTGRQKDFFPFLEADGYFNIGYENKDDDLKKYFTLRIPLNIYAENVQSLSETKSAILFDTNKKVVNACVLRSRRRGQEDQVELSIKSLDDAEFIEFRKLLRVNDFFVLLKRERQLKYDLVGIKGSDKSSKKLEECTNFYKKATQTPVDIANFENVEKKSDPTPFHPTQLIYYGVPGCGKSHRIKERLKGVPEENIVRVVFHPEYSNADFVGQIFPHVIPGGGVDYRFKPGPFAEIVRRAYRKQEEEFFLVIEEINRGNAAAIFGEMFQLLDRIKPGDSAENLSGNTYTEGFSAYGVNNDDVNAYVRLKNPGDKDPEEKISFAAGEFSLNTAIRLPPNLSIFATMNTSDQNVFALDNAFQRRFQTEMIPNVLDKDSEEYRLQIADTGVCWGSFREWINDKILSAAGGFSRGEDKCLGSYFITGEAGKISQKNFAEKVLKYLWDDVFRRSSGQNVFKESIRSLSTLIDEFEKANGFAAFENIFQLAEDDKSLLHKFAGESVGEISDESGEIVGENLGGENP